MKAIGPRALLAATLVFFISACSQTSNDVPAPSFAPQFGTAADDIGIDVAVGPASQIYSLVKQFGSLDNDGTSYPTYEKALLRRYDSSGKVLWTIEVDDAICEGDPLYSYCSYLDVHSLSTDAQGHIYVHISYSHTNYDNYYDAHWVSYTVDKYDATGRYKLDSVFVNNSIAGPEGNGSGEGTSAMAIDGTGNVYSAGTTCDAISGEEGRTAGGDCTYTVAKHATDGSAGWERTLTIGTPADITVSKSGSVYVVGTKGMARYSNSGTLTWAKSGIFEEVIVSGSNLYTRYRKDVRKFDGTGKQLWLRTQSGLKTMVFQDIDGDATGNVYLSGKYEASTGNMSAFTRKLGSNGSVLWTRTYGTPNYDDARGIATLSGSEVYVTGETQGSLAHANRGGPEKRDGYLRKLGSSGSPLWTR